MTFHDLLDLRCALRTEAVAASSLNLSFKLFQEAHIVYTESLQVGEFEFLPVATQLRREAIALALQLFLAHANRFELV